jgi:hypothetical protein
MHTNLLTRTQAPPQERRARPQVERKRQLAAVRIPRQPGACICVCVCLCLCLCVFFGRARDARAHVHCSPPHQTRNLTHVGIVSFCLLACVDQARQIKLYDIRAMKELQTYRGHKRDVNGQALLLCLLFEFSSSLL